MDIGAQVPHVAVRLYVMGERCYEDATADDIAAMAAITKQALADGALGFSTSRFYGHHDKAGNLVPGTHASAAEMMAIGEAFAGSGHGTLEIISDHLNKPEELMWIEHIARVTGRTLTTLVAPGASPGIWDLADRLEREGLHIRPQVGARPASVLMSLDGTLNPMRQFPAYRRHPAPAARRAAPRAARSRVPSPVLEDSPTSSRFADANTMVSTWHKMYVLPADLSYEPGYEDSIAGVAEAHGHHTA